jgi:DNA ligase-1
MANPINNVEFPKLTGEASTGKIKIWSIAVENRGDGAGWVVTRHGYEGGKIQILEKCVREGKNKGKQNETTPFNQAVSEARAVWQKKKDSGYTEIANHGDEPATAVVVKPSRSITASTDIPLPMLAHDFNKRGKTIVFPCYVQRKYDGTRCIAIPGKGLFSRNRKPYPNLAHIQAEIDMLGKDGGIILDGELYSDELTFQEIVGLVRAHTIRQEHKARLPKIKFHCYDIIDIEGKTPFMSRKIVLDGLFKKLGPFDSIRLVESEICNNREELKGLHDKYVSEGFEGIMLRNTKGVYSVGQRSVELQKYKEFQDAEYRVQDFTQGEGLELGCVIWLCKDEPTGRIFACRPRGSHEERRELYSRATDFIGKLLTVRFQEFTDDGLPRFPVGIEFRDYE